MPKKDETKTENLFRRFYGTEQFTEKTAIPKTYGFKSKKGTDYPGYPDFLCEEEDCVILVEAKGDDIKLAESEVQFYMQKNNIEKDTVGMAISGQSERDLSVSYFLKLSGAKEISELSAKGQLLSLEDIKKMLRKKKYKEKISAESLIATLKKLNTRFQKISEDSVSPTNRSLLFSGLLIALTDSNFRRTYRLIGAPSKEEAKSKHSAVSEAAKLNGAILDAIVGQISSKINDLSKSYNWADGFSFINYIDLPLAEYREIIGIIENDIFAPFQNEEKQDILGRAYRIFLSRTGGTVQEKNIIITPDHIKRLMVRLARVNKNDVVLDTCFGTGGFLMEAMETMVGEAEGEPSKIENIKDNQLIGFEIDQTLFVLACSNMFLHGDGRTNLIFGSSLLGGGEGRIINKSDEDTLRFIRERKPTKAIINPPYEGDKAIKFARQALEYLEPNGRLVIIMPTPTLKKNQGGLTEKILQTASLDFVIKMPNALFSEQKRTVNTSIFGFTKAGGHPKDATVAFYALDDDGFESVQHKGRIDRRGHWDQTERDVLDAVLNSREKQGVCEKKNIYDEKGALNCYGFSKRTDKGVMVKVSDLFICDERGTIGSEDGDGGNEEGSYDFITASEERKKHSVATHNAEAIVFAVSASGSLGRTHYVKGKFSASNLCMILTRKKDSEYKVDMRFYSAYFAAIRKRLVSDLADGTAKLIIRPGDLGEYYIEYVDYETQKRFVSSYIKKLESLERKYKLEKEKIEHEIQSVLSK